MLFLVACTVAISGCMPATLESGPPEVVNEITVILGEPGYTLNPYSPVLANRRVGHLIFSGLTRMGAELDPEPDLLAELPTGDNGGISPDGLVITYRLRDDATWHDGTTVTARDVVFTLEALRSGDLFDDSEVDYANIRTIAEKDDTTVVVTLERPDAPAVWRFAPFVLPAVSFEDESDVFSSAFWFAPVGSGPYQFAGGVPGGEIRLKPMKETGPALRLVFGREAAVQREAFDGADAAVWIDGPVSSAASESSIETSSSVWQVWLLNAGRRHETSDPALRSALSRIIPADPGVGRASVDPWDVRLDARSEPTTKQAEALLAGSGWDRAGDTRRKAGDEIDLRIASPTILISNEEFVNGLVDRLNGLGVKSTTAVSSTLGQGGLSDLDRLALGDYDIARSTIAVGAPYTVGWAFDRGDVPSTSRPYGSNVTRLDDARADSLANDVRESQTPTEAKKAMRALASRLQDTDTVLWDGQVTARWLVRGVDGVAGHGLPEYALASAAQWSVVGVTDSR